MRILWSILLLVLLIPASVEPGVRVPLGDDARIFAAPVALDPARPELRRVGHLVWLGGVHLTSPDPEFGGFSSLHVAGDRFTLLSDSGDVVRFTMGQDWKLRDPSFAQLPGGPGTGRMKGDYDSESMSVDPRTGDIWVGFENSNELWRYAPGFTRFLARGAPPVMRRWPSNEGAEAMTLLPGGGMVAIAETKPWPNGRGRGGVVFSGDPIAHPRRGFRFSYVPPRGSDPSDMTVLPDGRWLILNRRFSDLRFSSILTIVDPARVRPGAVVRGRKIATLAAPLIHDNLEGVSVTREGAATIVWLVSDDNQLPIVQRSLLLKFRLEPAAKGR